MSVEILTGDCREMLATLPAESVHCVVTSPPYFGLRDYGVAGQIGLEPSPDEFIAALVGVFREVRRVLRSDGTLWLNLGDSYSSGSGGDRRMGDPTNPKAGGAATWRSMAREGCGTKPKDLLMIPARVALALQADGWWLRSDIIWHKPNPMPESVTDRPTSAHEHVFLLSKSARYFYDAEAIREPSEYPDDDRKARAAVDQKRMPSEQVAGIRPGSATYPMRNARNVWSIATAPFSEWTDSIEIVPLPVSEALALCASGNAPGGDTARTTSQGCPLHGDLPDLLPKGFYDGLSADQVSGTRDMLRRDPGMPDGSDSIPPTLAPDPFPLSTADYSARGDGPSANSHSNQSHRTGRDPASSLHATPSGETGNGIERTEPEAPALASTHRDTGESKIAVDSLASRSAPQTAYGSSHTSESENSCASSAPPCCRYYRRVVTKTSHFATFPPALVEPCIKAGTSERGCCPACGAPWVRETEKRSIALRPNSDSIRGNSASANRSETPQHGSVACAVTTLGWSRSCACDCGMFPDPIPCTVLDPFGGAGTVGLVADRLQRNAVLIELNPEYAAMACRRIDGDAPLLTRPPQPVRY